MNQEEKNDDKGESDNKESIIHKFNTKKSSGGLNAWIIAAIALACVAAVVAVIIGIIVARKRKGQNPIPADSSIAINN